MSKRETGSSAANLGFEAELFKAADKLRGNMEPSDYKHGLGISAWAKPPAAAQQS